MKWAAVNLVGATAWLVGIAAAKSAPIFGETLGDHHVALALLFGTVGLAMLIWTNISTI